MPIKQPNIIWILSDQHRAQALSCAGDPNLSTPTLDRMKGAACSGIGGSPVCSPFRGSLLTSIYPHHCIPGHDDPLPQNVPTIAHTFKGAGYHTAYFGKWHVDGAIHRTPDTRPAHQFVAPERRGGFDCWIGYENNNAQYDCWVHGHDASGDPVDLYKLPSYETDDLTDLLINHLKNQTSEQPFFAVLAVQPPHSPYVAPEAFTKRHTPEEIQLRPNVSLVDRIQDRSKKDLAGYYAMIENLDHNTQRVLDTLKTTHLADNTQVIYFSDHGDMHGSQGRILKCAPWEESIRIPFLVSDGHGKALPQIQTTTPDLINHVDIGPTTLGLCGIDAPDTFQGADYSGYFGTNRPIPQIDSAYLQIVDPGYRCGFASDRERPWRGVITNDGWKYAILEGQPWLMYNLNEDPYETANLALDGQFRNDRQRLQDLLADWITRTDDTFQLPDITWVSRA